VLLQYRAIGGKDGDARTRPTPLPTTGGNDGAVRVPAHAVDTARLAEVVQHRERTEGSIVQDRVGAELAHRARVVVALREEQRSLIPGEQQPIRARGIEGQALDLPWSLPSRGRGDAEDRIVVELAVAMVVSIARVGEPDATRAIEHQIVGAIETTAFKAVDQRRLFTISPVTDDGTPRPLAGVERAIGAKRKTVRSAGVVVDGHDLAGRRVVAANLVVHNARVEESGSVPDRSLGDRRRSRQQLPFPRLRHRLDLHS
jgi:hypothetical protein